MDGAARAGDAPLDVLPPELWIVVWQRLLEESDKGNLAATCRYIHARVFVCIACIAGTRPVPHTQLAEQDPAAVQPVRALYTHSAAALSSPVLRGWQPLGDCQPVLCARSVLCGLYKCARMRARRQTPSCALSCARGFRCTQPWLDACKHSQP